jgi:hypothetical protein
MIPVVAVWKEGVVKYVAVVGGRSVEKGDNIDERGELQY